MAVRLGYPGNVAMQMTAHLHLPSRGCPGPSRWVVQPGPDGKGFEGGQEGLQGLCRETPVASGAGHHLGYKEDLVSLLHVSLELQQS